MKQNLIHIGVIAIAILVIGGSSYYYLDKKNIAESLHMMATSSNPQKTDRRTSASYYAIKKGQEPIEGDGELRSFLYLRFGDKILYLNKEIPQADKQTFEVNSKLGDNFARDKNYVYFEGKIVPGAKPSTFALVSPTFFFAKDSSSVYFVEHTMLGWKTTNDGNRITDIKKIVTALTNSDPRTFAIGKTSTTVVGTTTLLTTTASDRMATYTVKQERYACYGDKVGCLGNITITIKKKY